MARWPWFATTPAAAANRKVKMNPEGTLMRVTCCSLRFGTTYAEYALLDDCGELIEAGRIRMTKPALWNRFAALSLAVVAVNYDPACLWAVELLGQLGHVVVFSGAVPEGMRNDLKPAAQGVEGMAVLCPGAQGKAGVYFIVEACDAEILRAHYLIGPVNAGSEVRNLVTFLNHPAPQGSAEEQVGVVYQLLYSGAMRVPQAFSGDAVAAA